MRKVLLALMVAAGGTAAIPAAHAEDPLEGLEMDVVAPGETPSQAMKRIALPDKAGAQAHPGGTGGGKGHEPGREFGQSTAEQARSRKGNRGRAGEHGPPDDRGRPEHPGRPDDPGSQGAGARPDGTGRPDTAGSAAQDRAGNQRP